MAYLEAYLSTKTLISSPIIKLFFVQFLSKARNKSKVFNLKIIFIMIFVVVLNRQLSHHIGW